MHNEQPSSDEIRQDNNKRKSKFKKGIQKINYVR